MEPEISIDGNIEYHSTLNPAAWEDNKLKPEVRLQLMRIAKAFIDYLDVESFKLNDIVLTGSNANYNWTEHSDFDLHLITDYSELECDVIAEAFYRSKKLLWNQNHDITINGHDVELYVEDSNGTRVSEGVYSVLNDKWISEPEYSVPSINARSVKTKARRLATVIDYEVKNYDSYADLERLLDKLYDLRQAGLDDNGEFSTENLAFKILRNEGYLDKLRKALSRAMDDELSI